MGQLQPDKLTWAALLGRWVEFAQAAVALPDDADGRNWRQAVPAIIGLQAVTMALGDADQLAADQRALGLDRAEILINRHVKQLHAIFGEAALHPMLEELILDAHSALRQVRAMHAGDPPGQDEAPIDRHQ
jgi:hypothetical protein